MQKINTQKHIILGIDPGIERLGIAILSVDPENKKKETVLFSECFTTNKKDTTQYRLSLIYKHIEEIITIYTPSVVAIENIFFSVNQKTAVVVAQSRGVVLAAVGQHGLGIIELTPNEIKLAVTGYGKATKNDIIKMVPKIVNLPTNSLQDDEIDAIAIALCASGRLRYSQI